MCLSIYIGAANATQFGHRLPTGNGELAALDSAARSADYSISCGHPMAEPGIAISLIKISLEQELFCMSL